MFYRKEEITVEGQTSTNWVRGAKVINANFTLTLDNKDEHTYPVDGWEYHENLPQEYLDWVAAQELATQVKKRKLN